MPELVLQPAPVRTKRRPWRSTKSSKNGVFRHEIRRAPHLRPRHERAPRLHEGVAEGGRARIPLKRSFGALLSSRRAGTAAATEVAGGDAAAITVAGGAAGAIKVAAGGVDAASASSRARLASLSPVTNRRTHSCSMPRRRVASAILETREQSPVEDLDLVLVGELDEVGFGDWVRHGGLPVNFGDRLHLWLRLSRRLAFTRLHLAQSSTILPLSPRRMVSKPSRNFSAGRRWAMTLRTLSPLSSIAIILCQVSNISRP